MAASDDATIVTAPACIVVGMWNVLLASWSLLVGDDTRLNNGEIAECLSVHPSNVSLYLKKLLEAGSIKPGTSGRRGHYQRGNPLVQVRVRSDYPGVIYEGSVDDYLSKGQGPADENPDPSASPGDGASDEPDEDDAPQFAHVEEEYPDSVRSVIHPNQIVCSDQPLGFDEVRMGRVLYQMLGIFFLDVNLRALAKEADVLHPVGCLRRLLNVGAFKMRGDGLIGRGNPKVKLERADKAPHILYADLSQEESREEKVLRGVTVPGRIDLPVNLDVSGMTADTVAQYLVYWTTLQQQKRLLQEAEEDLVKLQAQQGKMAVEQRRLRKLQDSCDNKIKSAEASVANCKDAVRICEDALKAEPLRVAHNLTTLTLTSLPLSNGKARDR